MAELSKELVQYHHVDDLDGLAFLTAHFQHTQFSKHTHEGYCIGVIEEGAQSFLRTTGQYIAPKGDIILVNADEVHTGSSAVETGWCYRAIYPTPEMLQQISLDFFDQHGVIPWFPQAVIHDQGLSTQLRLLFDVMTQPNNVLFKQSLYISTMALLLQRHANIRRELKPLSSIENKIIQVKELLLVEPEKEHSLASLAQYVNLSQWHLLRQFKHSTGLPPHAWLIQIRLRKALKLLKQGQDIALTAQLCGFSDQSHFNRHFKRAIGCTPTQYLAYQSQSFYHLNKSF
ncbi:MULTISPECIES: AraC family transcriptional regulator [unclassified Acinetobacter]|uniref:AraC family transcriptional regulator n=1 Tax=unclassified Acinetobacter TaxID=196816 RepID=UPI0029352A49|nr:MULTISPECIES: AraC family transcriptional regulator [unclassified Acinetobacter]WOE31670.1 AraC family transcriptional regulator [Acinetobacter sp. SAAs470]WOE37135.1 AraC family transcriptional regulator [Acinetobacter sp. SAAs474]